MNGWFRYEDEIKRSFVTEQDSKKNKFIFRNENILRPRKNAVGWIAPRVGLPGSFSKQFYNYENSIPIVNAAIKNRFIPTKYDHGRPGTAKKCCGYGLKKFWKIIKIYLNETTLHGLKYIGLDYITIFERIFWLIAFLLAVSFTGYFLNETYDKWNTSPVNIGLNPKYTPITTIPFPAITICNMNQARKQIAEKINTGNDVLEKLLLADFCNSNSTIVSNNSTESSFSTWDVARNTMIKVSQPCSELIAACEWHSEDVKCDSIIDSTLTDEGVCCTFNRVPSFYMYHNSLILDSFNNSYQPGVVDWTPEKGYPSNATNSTWPFRPAGAGLHLGLTLVVNINADDYYCSSSSSIGLKLQLHNPVESPKVKDFGFFLHPQKEVGIVVKPTIFEATKTLINLPIVQRQCLFANERNLAFYRTYTKQNCELECESNFTLKMCECVPYYLPKSVNTTICINKKKPCYLKAKSDIETSGYVRSYCKCLPGCYEIFYSHEYSSAELANPDLIKSFYNRTRKSNTNWTNVLILHFYFATNQIRSYQKTEIFGFPEFLSQTGGFLGLFLGFSFLSAVEIGYHLTIRHWCTYIKKWKDNKNKGKNVRIYPFAK